MTPKTRRFLSESVLIYDSAIFFSKGQLDDVVEELIRFYF